MMGAAAILPQEQPDFTEEGYVLIRDLETFMLRFVVLPHETALPLSLWVLHTYTFQTFDAVPYLVINSPAPRCGKTRLLECLELLVSCPRRASNISESALFRTIEKFGCTLLLDEAESLNGKSERAEVLRQILLAGNRRGALATRCIGKGMDIEPKDFSVYCPKVVCGIGSFPAALTDRAIIIGMQRRKESEAVARFLYRDVQPKADALRERLARFIREHEQEIEQAYHKTEIDFIEDRDSESWAPLFAILAVAAPSRLNELQFAAKYLTSKKTSNAEDDSLPLRLLADLRVICEETAGHVLTTDVISRLRMLDEAPWSELELSPRKLARMLKAFGISRTTVRADAGRGKGYVREDLEAAFSRYLSRSSQEGQNG